MQWILEFLSMNWTLAYELDPNDPVECR
jgi:hypothetical protein